MGADESGGLPVAGEPDGGGSAGAAGASGTDGAADSSAPAVNAAADLAAFRAAAEAHGMAPDWIAALAPAAAEFARVQGFLAAEAAAGAAVLPSPERVFAAFRRPLSDVRVLIVGQDPYPTPSHPIGLSFATSPTVRPVPRSLANIFRELADDQGILPAQHGDLSAWSDAGVLLLNRVLTVRAGEAGSHRGRGWEAVTDRAIDALVERGGPLVAVLWGNDARSLAPRLPGVPTIESAHPSPLSASRGFFGSRPFGRANDALVAMGAEPIDWRVDRGPSDRLFD